MNFRRSGVSKHPPADDRHDWYNPPNESYLSSAHSNPGLFENIPSFPPHPIYYPGSTQLDIAEFWTAQYSSNANNSVSSPSTELASCQTVPTSSGWTSPLQSPQSVNGFVPITPSMEPHTMQYQVDTMVGGWGSTYNITQPHGLPYLPVQQHTPHSVS